MNSAGCNSGAFILDFHPPTSSPKELKRAFLRTLAHTFRRSQAGTIPVSFTTVRSQKMGAGIVKVCAFVRACVNCLWGESDGSVGKSSCFASLRTWIQFLEPTGERNSNLRPTKQNKTENRLLNKYNNFLVAMIKYLMGPDQVIPVILALEMQKQGDYSQLKPSWSI